MSDKAIKRFIADTEDEVMYVIQLGFQDTWKVVFDDAYEMRQEETLIGTKEEVEKKFNIKL